jgi:hypothetical protein
VRGAIRTFWHDLPPNNVICKLLYIISTAPSPVREVVTHGPPIQDQRTSGNQETEKEEEGLDGKKGDYFLYRVWGKCPFGEK